MNESGMRTVMNSSLFEGISTRDAGRLLQRLKARQVTFDRNEFILRAGERTQSMGMLLSGAAHVVKDDFWGNRTILSVLHPGDVFAENYALLPDATPESGVIASTPGDALLMEANEMLQAIADEPGARLAMNLLSILARRNLLLSRQAEILSKRTIRDRLMSYLSTESFHRGLASFEVPFTRQELADHLSVDRCALSTEITKMKEEGIIGGERRTFVMLRGERGQHEPDGQ